MMANRRRGVVDNDEFEMRKQERQAAIMMKVQDLTPEQTTAYLDTVCTKWKLDESANTKTFADAIDLAFTNFNIDPSTDINTGDMGSFGLRALDESIHDSEMEMIGLYNKLREHKLLENAQTMRRIMACLEQVYYSKRLVLNAFQGKLSVHQYQSTLLPDGSNPFELDKDLDARLGSWVLRFRWIDDDTGPYQKLLLFMLERAMERRYRRQGDWCFEPVIVNGHDTHAWRSIVTIKDWIYRETRKETNWEQWHWLTSNSNNPKSVETFLSNCCDYSFPELVKDRSTFSFINGVYRAKENKFYPHENSTLPNSIAACKFFDQEFPVQYVDTPAGDIPTPHIETIMKHQEWPEDVQMWMYVFLGRLLYSLNEMDSWQVIPFMCGIAGSGKCLRRDTLCMMSDMSVKVVQDIRVGDCLMGDDGTPRRVLGLARGREELFEVQWKHGSFQCTGEHILCVKYSNQKSIATWKDRGVVRGKVVKFWDQDTNMCRGKKFTTANAEKMRVFLDSLDKNDVFEMTVNEYMKLKPYAQRYLKLYFPDRMEFPECVDPPFDPYIFGVWLGDGTSASSGLTNFDQEVLDGVKENLPPNLQLTGLSTDGRYNMKMTSGKTNAFMDFLRSYDLVNNKHIPQDFLRMSVSNRLELMAGLMDTDGYKSANANPYFEITQKSQRVAEGIRRLAISLGFACSMRQVEKSCTWKGEKRTGTYYQLFICGDRLEDIPCRMERKRIPPGHRKRNPTVFGFTVRHVPGEQDYFGFQVDGNHRFCLASGIVSHNSTVALKVAKQFYDDIDVGCMSNNIESKFGLSQFHDKLLFVAPEIKNDLRIEQAEFQSLVSGEDITINQKHKTAFSTQWKVPGILAGNEVPQWCDNSGSIQRRIIVFTFGKQVANGDMKLGDKLAEEIPTLLLKCNKMYLEAVEKCGETNIWTVLPQYFHATRNELAQTTNVLEAFVNSEEIFLDKDAVVSFEDFKAALKYFTNQNNYSMKRMTWEYFRDVFSKYNVTKSRATVMYLGKRQHKDFLFGIGLTSAGDDLPIV